MLEVNKDLINQFRELYPIQETRMEAAKEWGRIFRERESPEVLWTLALIALGKEDEYVSQ